MSCREHFGELNSRPSQLSSTTKILKNANRIDSSRVRDFFYLFLGLYVQGAGSIPSPSRSILSVYL